MSLVSNMDSSARMNGGCNKAFQGMRFLATLELQKRRHPPKFVDGLVLFGIYHKEPLPLPLRFPKSTPRCSIPK